MRKLVQRYRDLGTKVTYVPAKCDDTELITNTYRWTTDLFGMQTIDWIDAKLKKPRPDPTDLTIRGLPTGQAWPNTLFSRRYSPEREPR